MTATPANVLLAEDDPHFAAWVVAVLQAECPDLRVQVVHDLAEAEMAWFMRPQGWVLAIVDMNLGADLGSDLIARMSLVCPDVPSLVVTAVEAPDRALAAIRAGAMGYILKSTIEAELVQVVRQVLAGGSPVTPSIARSLLTAFRETAAPPAADAAAGLPSAVVEKLSAREVEVLRLLARGYTDKEAAAQLDISPATVDTHVRKIFRKLSINSRVELRRLLA